MKFDDSKAITSKGAQTMYSQTPLKQKLRGRQYLFVITVKCYNGEEKSTTNFNYY